MPTEMNRHTNGGISIQQNIIQPLKRNITISTKLMNLNDIVLTEGN